MVTVELNDEKIDGMTLSQLKKAIKDYYGKYVKGTSVVNKQKLITVDFPADSVKHVIYARKPGYTKLKAVFIIKEMIKNAEYLNFKEPDEDDGQNILGYFNFKAKAKIEGNVHWFRIVIRLTNNGKFYYDHSVKVIKKPE